jgi:uncharacterized membrane protein YeiB
MDYKLIIPNRQCEHILDIIRGIAVFGILLLLRDLDVYSGYATFEQQNKKHFPLCPIR